MKNRILASLLSLSMLLQMLPITAFADESTIKPEDTQAVTAFEILSEDVATQVLSQNAEATPTLPQKLKATISSTIWSEVVQNEDGYVVDPDTIVRDENGNIISEETLSISYSAQSTEEEVDLAVKWTLPEGEEFSTAEPTTFVYTAELIESAYDVAVDMPTINVEIQAVAPIMPSGPMLRIAGEGTKADPYIVTSLEELQYAMALPETAIIEVNDDVMSTFKDADTASGAVVPVKGIKELYLNADMNFTSDLETKYPDSFFELYSGADLTVEGEGSIKVSGQSPSSGALFATNSDVFSMFLVGTNSTLNIESGYYHATTPYSSRLAEPVVIKAKSNAKVIINDGRFYVNPNSQNDITSSAVILVEANSFYGTFSIRGGTFVADGNAAVIAADGTVSNGAMYYDIKDHFTVYKATFNTDKNLFMYYESENEYVLNNDAFFSYATDSVVRKNDLKVEIIPQSEIPGPTSSFAYPIMVDSYEKLLEVFDYNVETMYIKLEKNLSAEKISLPSDKIVMFDLGGYDVNAHFVLSYNDHLEMYDSVGGSVVRNYNDYTLDMPIFSVKEVSARLLIESGTYIADSSHLNLISAMPSIIGIDSGATVTINGGDFTANISEHTQYSSWSTPIILNEGNLFINGGTFEGSTKGSAIFINRATKSQLDISNGVFYGASNPIVRDYKELRQEYVWYDKVDVESYTSGSVVYSKDNKTATVSGAAITSQRPQIVNHTGVFNVQVLGSTSDTDLKVEAKVTDGGTLTYQWYKSEGNPYNPEVIVGATNSIYTAPEINELGSNFYFCMVTNNALGLRAAVSSTAAIEIRVVNELAPTPTLTVNSWDKSYSMVQFLGGEPGIVYTMNRGEEQVMNSDRMIITDVKGGDEFAFYRPATDTNYESFKQYITIKQFDEAHTNWFPLDLQVIESIPSPGGKASISMDGNNNVDIYYRQTDKGFANWIKVPSGFSPTLELGEGTYEFIRNSNVSPTHLWSVPETLIIQPYSLSIDNAKYFITLYPENSGEGVRYGLSGTSNESINAAGNELPTTVKWDYKTKTITLNGYTGGAILLGNDSGADINAPERITLVGNNILNSNNNSTSDGVIYVRNDLIIDGTGTLTINNSSEDFKSIYTSYGENITIMSGSIIINHTNSTSTEDAIWAGRDLNIVGTANVDIHFVGVENFGETALFANPVANGKVIISTSGDVNVNMDAVTGEVWSQPTAVDALGLVINGTGTYTFRVEGADKTPLSHRVEFAEVNRLNYKIVDGLGSGSNANIYELSYDFVGTKTNINSVEFLQIPQSSVYLSQSYQISSVVYPSSAMQDVIYTISGNTSESTRILETSDGYTLYISGGETASQITITATSLADNIKSVSKILSVEPVADTLSGTISIIGNTANPKGGETLSVDISGLIHSGLGELSYSWYTNSKRQDGFYNSVGYGSTYNIGWEAIGDHIGVQVTSTWDNGKVYTLGVDMTEKATLGDAPAAPSVTALGPATITGKGAITGVNYKMEYSTFADFSDVKGVNSSDGDTIDGLEPGTTYYVRYEEAELAASPTTIVTIPTYKMPNITDINPLRNDFISTIGDIIPLDLTVESTDADSIIISQELTWVISGNTSADTQILGEAGEYYLKVGTDEKATSITLTATSVVDTTKSITLTVTINGEENNLFAVAQSDIVYGATPDPVIDYSGAGMTNGGSIIVEYAEMYYDIISGTTVTDSYSTTVPKNAGEYSIKVTSTATDTIPEKSVTTSFTIIRREVTATMSAGAKVTKQYDGTVSPGAFIGSFIVDGTVNGETVSVVTEPREYNSAEVGSAIQELITYLDGDASGNYLLRNMYIDVIHEITQSSGTSYTIKMSVKSGDTTEYVIDLSKYIPTNSGGVTSMAPGSTSNFFSSVIENVAQEELKFILDSTIPAGETGSVYVNIRTKNYQDIIVSVRIYVTDKTPVHLTFDEVEVRKNITDVAFVNTLTKDPADANVIFTSTNSSVAEVDADSGEVTIKGMGTTSIKAQVESTDIYEGVIADYILTVDGDVAVKGEEVSVSFRESYAAEHTVTLNGYYLQKTASGEIKGYPGYGFNGGVIGHVRSGSIVVTLTPEFISWLPTGEHTIGLITGLDNSAINFTVPQKSNTLLSLNGGGVGVSGQGQYQEGSIVKINAGTTDGYNFAGWAVEGASASIFDDVNAASTSLIIPATDVSITATWRKISSSGSGSSGRSSLHVDHEYDFWQDVKDAIADSDNGDTIKVDAKNYDKMPWSVMEALKDNTVNLVIDWNGGETILIPENEAQDKEQARIYWPLSLLAKRYAEAKLPEDVVEQQINPETGGVLPGGSFKNVIAAPAFADNQPIISITPEGKTVTVPSVEATPATSGFEAEAFAGTEDNLSAVTTQGAVNTGSNAFAIIVMLAAVLALGAIAYRKKSTNEK